MTTSIPDSVVSFVKSRFSELRSKIEKVKRGVEREKRYLKKFLERFPFRSHPERIDELKPEDVYNPGLKDYFFYYLEFKLRLLGKIRLGSAIPWEEAAKKIDVFKSLLKKVVDDSLQLHKKIDAEECEALKGWGGDRTIVKKIVSLYYLDDVIPVFSTKVLEDNVSSLNLWEYARSVAKDLFSKPYSELSVGEKFETLNKVLLTLKEAVEELKGIDNPLYMHFLRLLVITPRARPLTSVESNPINIPPLIFEPANEFEVLALFAKYHRELGFPYILKLNPQKFPDAVVIDWKRAQVHIEFELRSSLFIEHRHDPSKVDYIVCWIDDLPENIGLKKKVIELKAKLGGTGGTPSS